MFVELPFHLEYRAGNLPLIDQGTEIHVVADVRDPSPQGAVRKINATYFVQKRKLVYQTVRPSLMGLSQYLELTISSDS